jgi:hypothetical protein
MIIFTGHALPEFKILGGGGPPLLVDIGAQGDVLMVQAAALFQLVLLPVVV